MIFQVQAQEAMENHPASAKNEGAWNRAETWDSAPPRRERRPLGALRDHGGVLRNGDGKATETYSLVSGSLAEAFLLVPAPLGFFGDLSWRFVLSPLPQRRPIPRFVLTSRGIAAFVAGIARRIID